MNLCFYTPKHPILKKYIEGYYFICDNLNGIVEKYWTFPNNYCIFTINQNSNLAFSTNKIHISPSRENSLFVSCVYRYTHPIEVVYEKPIHEITLYFKPLGLNYFINDPDTVFSKERASDFDISFPALKKEMDKVFQEEDRESQIEAFEEYWLSIFRNKDLSLVQKVLSDVESNMKIEEVAKKNHISRKHLNALFLKYLGKPAVEYRKIHRFRRSLTESKALKNLTELSYENLFYDQSHLIKNFKALAGINPKLFFKNVNTQNKNVWLYI